MEAEPTRVNNPPQRYSSEIVEWLDLPPKIELQVYEEESRTILSSNDSPDISFKYSVNPYRGCFHGCAYCYARPTHQYLDFGAGTDFERKIVAKIKAPELLRDAFLKPSWIGEPIVFSGVTDCYQPLEASYQLTRRCLEVCAEFQNPVSIITKGALIRRDIDVLTKLHTTAHVNIYMSIAFADDKMSKLIEPYAPRPSVRFRAMQALHAAGIPVAVGVAPMIPGLNDSQIPEILERAAECGAHSAFMTLLRLPAEVREVFTTRLHEAFPTRAEKVLSQLRDMKGGELNRSEFGSRMHGEGPRWEAIEWLFDTSCAKLGLNQRGRLKNPNNISTFRRPEKQLNLF